MLKLGVTIYFIRHGEVEDRYHKVFGGSRIDMALSSLGMKQAEAVAAWLKDPPGRKEGSKMPNLNLSDENITLLVAYLESLQ